MRRDLRKGAVRCFRVIPAPLDKGPEALACAEKQVGEDYAFVGVAALVLDDLFTRWNIFYTRPGHWTCGQFVARAFEQAGVRLFPGRDPVTVTPWDFSRLLDPDARFSDPPLDASDAEEDRRAET